MMCRPVLSPSMKLKGSFGTLESQVPQGSIYPIGTRFHIPDFSLISDSPGDKASTPETPHLSARRKGALPKVRSPGQPERERERERERALLRTISITGWSRARPADRRCLALCGLQSRSPAGPNETGESTPSPRTEFLLSKSFLWSSKNRRGVGSHTPCDFLFCGNMEKRPRRMSAIPRSCYSGDFPTVERPKAFNLKA